MKITSEKEYLPPDPSNSKRHKTLKEAHAGILTDEEWDAVEQETKAMSCARHLTSMRIRAGISQNIMAAALNCRQPRISEIESTPNEHISMTIILKYCEVTGLPFKAELENGRTVSVSRPRRKKGKNGKAPGSTRSAATA